jgi:outer membrane protein assembly factor BamB
MGRLDEAPSAVEQPMRSLSRMVVSVALLGLAAACGSVPVDPVDMGEPVQTTAPSGVRGWKKGALEEMNFHVKWELETGRHDFTHMTLQDNALYAFTSDFILYSIDIDKGIVNWVFQVGEPLSYAPVVYKYDQDSESGVRKFDEVLLLSGDRLRVLDKDLGELLWQKDLPFAVASPPAATQGNVLVGSFDDRVYAVMKDSPHGRSWMWRTNNDIRAPGVEYDPLYIAVSTDGAVYAFSQVGGELRWKKETRGPIVAPPVAFRGKLYVGSSDYSLYCIDLLESSLQWRYESGGPIRQPAIAFGDMVYVISEDRILSAIHRVQGQATEPGGRAPVAGDVAWKLELGRKNFDRPSTLRFLARGRDRVYVLNEERQICVIDARTGDLRMRLPFRGIDFFTTNVNSLASDSEMEVARGGTIFVGRRDGWFFALKEKSDY